VAQDMPKRDPAGAQGTVNMNMSTTSIAEMGHGEEEVISAATGEPVAKVRRA